MKSVKACEVLHDLYKKICASSEEASKDRGKKQAMRQHIDTYVKTFVDVLNSGALDADPFGVINKNGLVHIDAHKAVDAAIKKYNCVEKKAGEEVTTLDKYTFLDKIRSGVAQVKGSFSNGVKYVFDRETGVLVLSYRFVQRQFGVACAFVHNTWKNICEFFKALFASKEEELVVVQ